MNPWHDERGRFTSPGHVSHFTPTNPAWFFDIAEQADDDLLDNSDETEFLDFIELNDDICIDAKQFCSKFDLFKSNLSWYKDQNPDAEFLVYFDPQTGEADFLVVSIDSVYAKTVENYGVSFDMSKASEPKDGYMVAACPERSDGIDRDASNRKAKRKLRNYIYKNRDLLLKPGYHLGTWIDENGNIALDISERIKKRGEAVTAGTDRNEKAIFDIKRCEEIPIGGTGSYDDKLES